MEKISEDVFYEIVNKERLTDRKKPYELPEQQNKRLKTIIPIGTKNYDQMNGYRKFVKSLNIDFEKQTLLIFEYVPM